MKIKFKKYEWVFQRQHLGTDCHVFSRMDSICFYTARYSIGSIIVDFVENFIKRSIYSSIKEKIK